MRSTLIQPAPLTLSNRIRAQLNRHPIVTVIVVLAIVSALFYWAIHDPSARIPDGDFLDEQTGESSIRSIDQLPPLMGSQGKPTVVRAYYTGLDMLSGRIGAVRNDDLEPAWNPSGTAINALHIFLSCSNLFNAGTVANSEAGIQEYWGFLNTFGNFGQVHGSTNTDRENYFPTASRGGTKMNVMGLDGGVTVVDAKTFPATE